MTIRIVRLGSPRRPDEGPRIGTVRQPPRGVPRERFGPDDWYDTWFPLLAPSADTIQLAQAAKTPADWARFVRTYRREMGSPEARQALDLLAALSHTTNFSVGCYCEDEAYCHRSVLRLLLLERGADVDPSPS